MTILETTQELEDHIVVGDMNLHHPIWGRPYVELENAAEELLDIIQELDPQLLIE
jgi:hypothetical protein